MNANRQKYAALPKRTSGHIHNQNNLNIQTSMMQGACLQEVRDGATRSPITTIINNSPARKENNSAVMTESRFDNNQLSDEKSPGKLSPMKARLPSKISSLKDQNYTTYVSPTWMSTRKHEDSQYKLAQKLAEKGQHGIAGDQLEQHREEDKRGIFPLRKISQKESSPFPKSPGSPHSASVLSLQR